MPFTRNGQIFQGNVWQYSTINASFTRLTTIQKIKHMAGKHDAWIGAMVWPHHALVKIGECFPCVVMCAFHKSNHHRGSYMVSRGKSPRLKGVQISFVL